jgi:hypothetical protein
VGSQPENTEADFSDKISDGYRRIVEYNGLLNDQTSYLNTEDAAHLEYISNLKELMTKIKSYDKTTMFFDKLYKYFVKEFSDRLENLRFSRTELDADARTWLFEQVFNIAFHTADYTEHFVKHDEVYFHDNVQLLINDLDLKKIVPKEFIENDLDQSSRSANSVAKALRFAGIRKVSFLVNKYYIKPDQRV